MKVDLEDGEKSALVWEVHEKAIDLFLRRWKFRIGMAVATVSVVALILGFRFDQWVRDIAKEALDERIKTMVENEQNTIRRIQQEQAIALQGVVVRLEETERTAQDTLVKARELSAAVDNELANVNRAKEEVESLVDAVEILESRRSQLPALAKEIQGIESDGLEILGRVQSVEEIIDGIGWALNHSAAAASCAADAPQGVSPSSRIAVSRRANQSCRTTCAAEINGGHTECSGSFAIGPVALDQANDHATPVAKYYNYGCSNVQDGYDETQMAEPGYVQYCCCFRPRG